VHACRPIIVFIRWWHETGLASFDVPCAVPLSQFLPPLNIATPCSRAFRIATAPCEQEGPSGHPHTYRLVDFRTEDQNGMCEKLQVRWTITPETEPQPWIACGGCGTLRPFRCSNKIRLNANGRKLDAWLIYHCLTCGKTWNHALFERRNVRDVAPKLLAALHSNDPDWIRSEAFNVDALRRKSQRIDEFPEFEIKKHVVSDPATWHVLEIELVVVIPVNIRLDRLLASELGISRSRLTAMHGNAMLRSDPDRADILRRRIRTGTRIRFDFSDGLDGDLVWKASGNGAGSGS